MASAGPLFLSLPPSAGSAHAEYRLAGQPVAFSAPLASLASFRSPGREVGPPEAAEGPSPVSGRLVYRGPAWVGRQWRQVECRGSGAGYSVTIDGLGVVQVAPDGSRVGVEPAGAPGDALVEEAAVGPALTLALALRGVFCLHASAVLSPGRELLLFAGASGAGKSTLARLLDGAAGWARAADDIVPVAWSAGRVQALLRFPQLKLPPDAQPGAVSPERMPVARICVLAPGAPGEAIRMRPLSTREATLALVRHTATARLFDRDLLERHLEACARMANAGAVPELTVPWTGTLPPDLTEVLTAGPEAA